MNIATQEDFDQIETESLSTLVVLDFYADWCGPCKRYKPTFEKVAESTTGVLFGSVDCEALPEVAAKYGIQGIPCTVTLVQGKVKGRQSGALSEAALREFIEKNR